MARANLNRELTTFGAYDEAQASERGRAGRSPSDTIIVFRIPGSWEPEAKAILAEAGIEALGREISLDAAAKLAVQRSNEAACGRSEVHVA